MGRLTSLAEALLTPHGADRYLELLDPLFVRNETRGRVTAVRRQTPGTVTLTIRPNRKWRGFSAGQYVRVSVEIDGVWRTRCYSPACSQHRADGLLELTVKAAPDGLVSGFLHRNARPGLVLGLSAAEGGFTLPEQRPEKVLLISGGSGITPVLSMLRTLADEDHPGEVALLHYENTPKDLPYRTELGRLREPNRQVRFACTMTESGADLHGFFSAEHLAEVAPWYRDAETYLCGPKSLMDSVREHYETAGLSERLHTEEFTPPQLATGEAGGLVRFTRSGREFTSSGKPLLEDAEEAGLRPEHGCRMGICFSCTQLKTAGRVRNLRTGEVSAEENEEIQLCISAPGGDVEINA